MKAHHLQFINAGIAIVALFAILGWAGNIDYTEQCILNMSCEEYDTVKASLTRQYGQQPSQRDIARWWAEHHKD